jgi:hypothetical protein
MKQAFILLFAFLSFTIGVYAQEQTDTFDQYYSELLDNLSKEDWEQSYSLSQSLLKSIERDTSRLHMTGVIRYMHLISIAGLMNGQQMTMKEAIQKGERFKNKFVVLPGHTVKEGCPLNCISYADESPNTLFVCQTNQAGTQIFSFEYALIKKGITKEELMQNQDKNGEISGIVETIDVEGNMFPRFRIHLKDAKIEYKD